MATKKVLIWGIARLDFMEEGSRPVRTALGEWNFSGSAVHTLSFPIDPCPMTRLALDASRRDGPRHPLYA
jgi:hypothetical protein